MDMRARLPVLAFALLLCATRPIAAQDAGNGAPPTADKGKAESTQPAATPEAESAPPAEAPRGPDVSALRKDLSAVLDELTQARARASSLVKALFGTRVSVSVARRADDQRLSRIILRFDGVPVHDSEGTAIAREEARLFDGFAAPGVHELTIVVSEASPKKPDYSYTREEKFRFEIKKGTATKIRVLLRDKSDMAEELPEDDEGEYHVETTVRVERESLKED
jgi:hypothetical protein